MVDPFLAVTGTAVCLPNGQKATELYESAAVDRPLVGSIRRFAAEDTDLAAVEIPVGSCPDPRPPSWRPVRLSGLPRESRLAVCVAADTLGPAAGGSEVGVVWVSSTAGLDAYGQTCVDAAARPPGQASPMTSPLSGYSGPATAVSIRLALTGPLLMLTGGREAGATAVVEAGRLLAEKRCRQVLVGGSAALDRWRLAAVPGDMPAVPEEVPAEGAACLLLSRDTDPCRGTAIRPLRRVRLRGSAPGRALSTFVEQCLRGMSGAPEAIALSAATGWGEVAKRAAVSRHQVPCWRVERSGGGLGAAGGFQAVMTAVGACAAGIGRVLVLAVGGAGDAVAVEVVPSLPSRGTS